MIKIRNFINNIDFVLTITIIAIFSIELYIFNYSNIKSEIMEVKDKYVKNNGDVDKYIVIDSNNNAYEIRDLLFIGKFNSTDIYALLEIGKTYTITTSGIRFRIFSKYPNINKVEELKEDTDKIREGEKESV